MILPTPGAGFVWRGDAVRPALVCVPLERVAAHMFTTAAWSLGTRASTSGQDDPWAQIAQAIGVAANALMRTRQVHGASVLMADGPIERSSLPEADAIVLTAPNRAAAVQVADCVPILLADPVNGAVAAVHAGWRGLVARTADEAIRAMTRAFGSSPRDLIAAIGPSVGACCYEVSSEVRDRFDPSERESLFRSVPADLDGNPTMPEVARRAPRPGHWYFDPWEAARVQLAAAGVPHAAIHVAALCTASHPEVFCSFRRDGAAAGRQAAAIRGARS